MNKFGISYGSLKLVNSGAWLFTGTDRFKLRAFGFFEIPKFLFSFGYGILGCLSMPIYADKLPSLPPDFDCIKVVASFEELASSSFGDGINALCWPRVLEGDFAEVVEKIGSGDGITILDESLLQSLQVSQAGRLAISKMLEDERLLSELGLDPVLNCIHGYPSDEDAGPVSTDVFSFHADSAPVQAETWLCTYFGASSEAIRNEDAMRHVDIPATRAALLELFGGHDDEGFSEFLTENCYNLHYTAVSNAKPYSFGIGNLWRIAVEHPGCPVPPCIHRAPKTDSPRLLLIS